MSEENTIKINPSKPTEHEFDVVLSGIDHTVIPMVRFVIVSDDPIKCDESYRCTKVKGEKSKWLVKLPSLTHIESNPVKFRVEVIVEEYYFEPAQGEISFITASDVHFKTKAKKPSVEAKVVKDEEKPADKKETEKPKKEEKVKESVEDDEPIEEQTGGGGPDVTGRYGPTNALLKPEEDPTANGRRMRQDNAKEDEFTDKSQLFPGEDPDARPDDVELEKLHKIASGQQGLGQGKQYAQEDGKNGEDARTIADRIIKDKVGSVKAPAKKGTLFKRDANGKPIVAGLEDEETKKKLADKAAKVKEILKKSK